jgi:hypothetical protein
MTKSTKATKSTAAVADKAPVATVETITVVEPTGAANPQARQLVIASTLETLSGDNTMSPKEALTETLSMLKQKNILSGAQYKEFGSDESILNAVRNANSKANEAPSAVTVTKADGTKKVEPATTAAKPVVAKTVTEEVAAPVADKKKGKKPATAAVADKPVDETKPAYVTELQIKEGPKVPVSLRVAKNQAELLEFLLSSFPVELITKVNYFTLNYKGRIIWTVERTQDAEKFTFLTNRADLAAMLPLFEKVGADKFPEGFYYDKDNNLDNVKLLANAHWKGVVKVLG